MVERARLTPRLVFEAACPNRGERWIADTKIKGFGLRLWATKSGGQKAFAIRVSDPSARKIRRTFDPGGARRTNFELEHSYRGNKYSLGEYLDEAREWARDEIDRIKLRPTAHHKALLDRVSAKKLVRSMTLQRAASALLVGLDASRASEAYRDRLDKLFAAHVPDKMKQTTLENLNPRQAARALVEARASPGNIRVLRSFISQIIERGASFSGSLGRFRDDFAEEFGIQWERTRDVRYPELRKLGAEKYRRIFNSLESDEEHWQQAMAIRLYFAFRTPLNRILRGQWKQIHESYWYPYWPTEKKLWLECREEIEETAEALLKRVRQLGLRDFGGSSFWFPSRHARKMDHIRAVEHAWRRALRESHVHYYPLREFSRSFREFNNPSYYASFLGQHGPMILEADNMAEVSKHLIRSSKS